MFNVNRQAIREVVLAFPFHLIIFIIVLVDLFSQGTYDLD